MGFAEDLDHQVQVAAHDAHALVEGGFGQEFAGLQVVERVLEDPGVVEGAAADADAGAAGLVEHHFRGLGSGDIAVADDGDGFEGLHDGADAGQADRAGESLRAGAAMDEDGGDAGVFERARQVRGGDVVVVPAEAHLGRNGDLHCLDHAFDEAGGLGEFGHHGGAAADAADLADGATHVDVHGGDAERFEVDRRVAHFFGHGAEQLDGQRSVGGGGFDELEGLGLLLEEGAGVDEVGGGEAEAAQFADGEAEREVGVAGQRREEEVGRQCEGPETHWRKHNQGERPREP